MTTYRAFPPRCDMLTVFFFIFSCFTQLSDLAISCPFDFPHNLKLPWLESLCVGGLASQEDLDSLHTSYSGSYYSLKNLRLIFYDSEDGMLATSLDTVTEFISKLISLESLDITLDSLGLVQHPFIIPVATSNSLQTFCQE